MARTDDQGAGGRHRHRSARAYAGRRDQPGEPLLDLVPKADRLVVEAQVRPEDIDRLHAGLTAQVRLLPYKTRRTPPLDAQVIYVSADRLVDKHTDQPYFAVKLRIDPEKLKALPAARSRWSRACRRRR